MWGRMSIAGLLLMWLVACTSSGSDTVNADDILERLDEEFGPNALSPGITEYYGELLLDGFDVDRLDFWASGDAPLGSLNGFGFVMVATDEGGFDEERRREFAAQLDAQFGDPFEGGTAFRGDVAIVVVGDDESGEMMLDLIDS